jgi:uncharacterized membrane-anchored protein
VKQDNDHRRFSGGADADHLPNQERLPVIGRFFPAPVAAKVPEVIFLFWVVKILTTAGGEATSDHLKIYGNFKGGGAELALFVVGFFLQFATRRYSAFAYWFFAYAIAVIGTGVSDFLHLDAGIPYLGTTLLWTVVLLLIFFVWYRREGTLSIHSITSQRREGFYWATVFATFALGTALGDYTATSLNLGYLDSGVLFTVVIFVPALARWRFGLNGIAAFWMSYVLTRPLGASYADYISKPQRLSGIDFGDGPTAAVFALAVLVFVIYLAVARSGIQRPRSKSPASSHSASSAPRVLTVEPELDLE